MIVLTCKACDKVATVILSDLAFLKQLVDKVGGFSLLSLISFKVIISPQLAVFKLNYLYMTSYSL
jgi:hypothetical protein